jgi:DUF4097 and DUF4098 domain-containing protein YvlB
MKKSMIWMIAIFLVLIASVILCGCVKPSELETHEYEIREDFKDITIITDTADIQFILSENPSTLVVCEEEKNAHHSVFVQENALRIEVVDQKKGYEQIGISLRTPKITVYLGKSEWDNISLEADTGNISLDHILATGKLSIEMDTGDVSLTACNASEILIETDTGNVTLNDVIATGKLSIEMDTGDVKLATCDAKEVLIETSTGNVALNDAIAAGKLAIETDTGNVKFAACDASEVFIHTDSGNVTGSFLTDKVIFAESDTGKIDIPKVMAEEKCEIITDTGNIKITIEQGE